VRGQILLARLEYLREVHGPDGLQRVLSALSAEDRTRLASADRQAWYPFRTLMRLDKAIAEVLAPGVAGIYETLGEASARHRTEWLGEHARLVNPHGFLSRVADEHRLFHTFGKAVYRRTGFTEGEIAYSEYPETDLNWCRASRGYFRGAIELLTGGPVKVEETKCQCRGEDACVFQLHWMGSGAIRIVPPKKPGAGG
jgi:uncharacterized protein (TIGR02265 family)